ncbi:MAG: PAS domain S-box protein [Bacteroidales bacterium]
MVKERNSLLEKLAGENSALRQKLEAFTVEELNEILDRKVNGNMGDNGSMDINDSKKEINLLVPDFSEKMFRFFTENIPDIIWTMDVNGNFTYLSPSAKKYGLLDEDLKTLSLKDILTEEDYRLHSNNLKTRVELEKKGERTGQNFIEVVHKAKNGTQFHAEILVNPIRNAEGNLIGLLGVTRDVSLRKKIEQDLKKFSVVVEQNPASVVITDTQGKIEYVNETFSRVTGYSLEEAVGNNPSILKSGKTPSNLYTELWQTIWSGNVWKGEFINRTKSGQDYWEKAIIAPIKNNKGSIINFVSIKENITDKKNAEIELNESRERYKFLADMAIEGIIVFDDHKIIDANKSASEITGLSINELTSHLKFENLFAKESQVAVQNHIQNNSLQPVELMAVKKDGSLYPAELEVRKYHPDNSQIYVAALRETTYRKKVEEVLRASLMLNNLSTSNDENYIINWGLEEAVKLTESKTGFLHFINEDQQNIERQIWTSNQAKENNFSDKEFHDSKKEENFWKEIIQSQKPGIQNNNQPLSENNNHLIENEGLKRYISIPISENNKVKIIFGVGNKPRDYTQFDLDLLNSLAENLWTVIQRKRFENKLIEANSSKDRFLSIISHDLRSPIGSIQSLTDILDENLDNLEKEELRNFIKIISDTSKATYNLLDNMLIWAQSQSRKLEFNPDKIDIRTLIEEVVLIFQYQTGKKNILMEVNLNADTIVRADRNMLQTVIRNLVSNAIKFTSPEGKVSIMSKLYGNEFLEIVVKDTGIGISDENMGKIFNTKENFSTRGTDNEKGTGLGLVICKDFIELNSGKIWFISEAGKGTEFHFTLPLVSKHVN